MRSSATQLWRDDDPRPVECGPKSRVVHVPDSDDGRRTATRRDLSRRLLDDPVVYTDSLDPVTRAYFLNQRGPMGARLAEAAGLVPEQRAEGLALADETGTLTDLSMRAIRR